MSLRIIIHNVGHGQSIHAFTPNGHTVVIDLGCSSEFSPLEWLKECTSTINLLVITHPHGDHIDEISTLKDLDFDVKQLWRAKWLTDEEIYNANQANYRTKVDDYLSLFKNYSPMKDVNKSVGNPAISGGVSIKEFASTKCGRSNINNHSGVVVFDYLDVKVVIPGDNEPASWNALLKGPDFLSAVSGTDIFVASHHGRETGYCSDLFDAFKSKPKLCIVSDGRVQDTDATSRYSYHASGCTVHNRNNGGSKSRACVTTRSDGFIEIEIGENDNGSNYLSVTTD